VGTAAGGAGRRSGRGQASRADSLRSLGYNFAIALSAIYVLLAVPFRSYTQPFVIMSAIPFGIIGAVWGHVLMGIDQALLEAGRQRFRRILLTSLTTFFGLLPMILERIFAALSPGDAGRSEETEEDAPAAAAG